MKLLGDSFYVLWAAPAGEKVPFEVSREVPGVIHPRCPNSPYCPGERMFRVMGRPPRDGGSRISTAAPDFDPDFVFDPAVCPYRYASKDECFRAINRTALRAACIPERDLRRIAGFLQSLRYAVKAERLSDADLDGGRILMAHGPIYNFHDLRVEHAIGGQDLYLIRNPSLDGSPPGCVPM
jgi:hypothetical protein